MLVWLHDLLSLDQALEIGRSSAHLYQARTNSVTVTQLGNIYSTTLSVGTDNVSVGAERYDIWLVERAMSVWKGNGYERDFMDDENVYIMDVYNFDIYPHDRYAKRMYVANTKAILAAIILVFQVSCI